MMFSFWSNEQCPSSTSSLLIGCCVRDYKY